MANMKIITGATGTAHVQAADDRALNYSAFGGDGILTPNGTAYDSLLLRGENVLSARLVDSSTVRITEGDIVIQGCHARLEYGQHIDLSIEPGVTGYKRRDAIAAHYNRDELGVESVELVMLTGTPTTGEETVWPTEVDPSQPAKSIYEGDTDVYSAIYVIDLDGTTVGTPKLAVDVIKPVHEVGRYVDELARKYDDFANTWETTIMPGANNALGLLSETAIHNKIEAALGGAGVADFSANITGAQLDKLLKDIISNTLVALLVEPISEAHASTILDRLYAIRDI